MTTEDTLTAFFRRYGALMDAGVRSGAPDAEALAACFAGHFVGSSPAGILGGAKDAGFAQAIAAGVAQYRAMGATGFAVEAVRPIPLDPLHAAVQVDWRFDYRRPADGVEGGIRFTNSYLVSLAGGEPQIFAWITPDEQAALRAHGLA